jgi:hypothetical protein
MAIDNTPRTGRAILAGGLAAAAAASLGRAQPASAHDADDVQLGADNTTTTRTNIENTTEGDVAFRAVGNAIGVIGNSDPGIGVYGSSNSGNGVFAVSNVSTALYGYTTPNSVTQAATLGRSAGDNTGVHGHSGQSPVTVSAAKTGVYGYAGQDATAVGVRGASPTGRGGLFSGKRAQLRLIPSTATTHPSSGIVGDLFLDKNKRLWFCKGGTTWKQLA